LAAYNSTPNIFSFRRSKRVVSEFG